MGRVREFDTDTALEQAMEVFWRKGYDGTSIQDLAEATGLGRGSLYSAFQNKEALYVLALRRYVERTTEQLRHQLVQHMPLREALRGLLAGRVDDTLAVPGRPGCMLVNAVVNQVPHDPDTRRIIRDALTALRDLLSATLHTARSLGELPEDADIDGLAFYFVTMIQGVRITGTVFPDHELLDHLVDTALTVLPARPASG